MTDQITTPAQMREAAALLPCPFCGGEANVEHSIHDDDHRFPRSFWHVRVICMGCDLAQRWALYGKQEPRYNDHEGRVEAEAAAIAAWNRRALPMAEPEPLAVTIKPLVWEETHDDRGDGSSEHNGCYEASTALGVYEIGMGFGSDAYYWSVCDPNYNEIGSFEGPSYAQAAAEADHAARILSQIETLPVAQVRAEALDALLADDEMCLRLAEGYDREDAAQRGEPSPHSDEEGYAEWAADRIACAKEGMRAIRALMEKPA